MIFRQIRSMNKDNLLFYAIKVIKANNNNNKIIIIILIKSIKIVLSNLIMNKMMLIYKILSNKKINLTKVKKKLFKTINCRRPALVQILPN